MFTRSIVRWIGLRSVQLARLTPLLPALAAGSMVACGSSSGSQFDGGPTSGADSSTNGSSGGGDGSSNTPGDDGSSSFTGLGDGSTSCVPKTCQNLGYNCGQNSDGCGGFLDCGTCPAGQTCGAGGFSVCGAPNTGDASMPDGAPLTTCTPNSCTSLGYTCGRNGDGCGGILDCGTCTAPDTCGGGGFSKCGSPVVPSDAGSSCTPTTCAALGYDCGPAPDGCGGLLQCGTCMAPETCGGAGGFSKCGLPPGVSADGGVTSQCVPTTCAAHGYDCGPASDGCGGLLQCGTCTAPEVCGAGGFSKCGLPAGVLPDGGSAVSCTPTSCAAHGYTCGPASDGCGNLLMCGSCGSGQTCGGGGFDICGTASGGSADGGSSCTPKTCQSQGINCGPAGDGCGNLLQCGSCNSPQTCGGGGVSGQCGCQGLCAQVGGCAAGVQTTVTGTVRAGQSAWTLATPDPVPNALVYVPNDGASGIQPFAAGAACRTCGADVSGNPLVSTYTDFDGTFTLKNVPAGASVPIVIQLGRWRRVFSFNVPSCTTTPLGNLNLPRNKSEGQIPLTAISTGSADPLECVLLKMGVDQDEFTPDTGTGRIHIYGGGASTTNTSNGNTAKPGVTAGTGTHPESTLFGTTSGGTFMNYDQILLPCWGAPAIKTAAQLGDLVSYADGGGHLFDTHYSYSWLTGNGEFNSIAHWHTDYNNPGNVNWTLNVSTAVPSSPPAAHGGVFAKWLNLVGALSNSSNPAPAQPQVLINNPRHDADYVTGGSTDWIDGTDPDKNNALVEHFTFDTPVGGSQTCGHGIFSDFHVSQVASKCSGSGTSCASNADCTANTCSGGRCTIGGAACTRNSNCQQCVAGTVFPNECTTTFTAQEKILEYMLFDLASCAGPLTPTCNPLTCAQQNVTCGPTGDGCGGQLDCGTCTAPLTCGGGGVAGQCGAPDGGTCKPESCQAQNLSCGQTGDGCGGVLNCGTCTAPAACVNGQCVAPDASGCTMLSCQAQNLACGQTGDGCGGVLNCGTCTAPATCVSGQCVTPEGGGGGCSPATCASQNLACGQAGDGCGGTLNCGTCPAGSSCVGGQCLAPDAGGCVPATCSQQNLACGQAGDGCGGVLDCGTCPAGSSCVSGQCVAPDASVSCTPITCQQQNINCGYTGDGCGNLLDCGTCVAPETCGGGGVAGQCGGAAQ